MSVSGAGGATSRGAPTTRRHPPPGTRPSTRGVRSEMGYRGREDLNSFLCLRTLKFLNLHKITFEEPEDNIIT